MRSVLAFIALAVLAPLTVVTLGSLPASAAPSAPAATARGFRDLVVDQAAGRVFVSMGPAGVLVYDLDGALVSTLTGLGGADDLLVSADGATLYVAEKAARAVAAVDVASLTTTTTFPTGDECPAAVTQVQDILWMASPCDNDLAALDLATGGLTRSDVVVTTTHPLMATSTQEPGLVAFADRGANGDQISLYDASVADGFPTLAVRASVAGSYDPRQLAFAPRGSALLVGEDSAFVSLSTTNLYELWSDYSTGSVAVRSDGEVAAGSLDLYHPQRTSPWRHYVLPAGGKVVPGGLAWGARQIYAEVRDGSGLHLRAVTPRAESRVSVTARHSTYPPQYGDDIPLQMTLRTSSANRLVRVYSVPADGPRTLVAKATVPPKTRVKVRVRAVRNTTFEAVYAGDDATDGSRADVKLTVRATATSTFVRAVRERRTSDGEGGHPTVGYYRSGTTARVVGTVGAFGARCAVFSLAVFEDGRWKKIYTSSCLHPDKHHHVSLTVPSKRGSSYQRLQVQLEVRSDDDNQRGDGYNLLQFCASKIPC